MFPTLKTYQFEGQDVRVSHEEGQVWFVAADICAVLGLSNPSKTLAKIGVVNRGYVDIPTKLGSRKLLTLSLEGLRHLTYSSRKPFAKPLQAWAIKRVLPDQRGASRSVQSLAVEPPAPPPPPPTPKQIAKLDAKAERAYRVKYRKAATEAWKQELALGGWDIPEVLTRQSREFLLARLEQAFLNADQIVEGQSKVPQGTLS